MEDYSRLFSDMDLSRGKVEAFYYIDQFTDYRKKGIVSFGMIISSAEDISSHAYRNDLMKLAGQQSASFYLCSPVVDSGRYCVYYIFFTSSLAYNMYCIFMDSRKEFSLTDTAIYLLN